MLVAKPHSCFSWSFSIFDDEGNQIADISQQWFRERGEFRIGSHTFGVQRDSLLEGIFSLRQDDSVLVTAKKKSMFLRSFDVQIGNTSYTLAAVHPFTRRFILQDQNGQNLGEVCPSHLFTRQATITFSEEFPVAIRVFFFWLVLILWRRQASNNNS